MIPDGAAPIKVCDGFERAHEAETPVGRYHGHEMEHEGGEDWVHAVFDQEGNFGNVVGGGGRKAIVELYAGEGRERGLGD